MKLTLSYEAKPLPTRQLMGGLLIDVLRYRTGPIIGRLGFPWASLISACFVAIESLIRSRNEWVRVDPQHLPEDVYNAAANFIAGSDLKEKIASQVPRILRLPVRFAIGRAQRLLAEEILELKALSLNP